MPNLELWTEFAGVPPCSLCRAPAFREGCARCEARRNLFRPLTTRELVERRRQMGELHAQQERAHASEARRLAALSALGRPVVVGLVGCGKQKVNHPAPARELYTSVLFRRSLQLAKRTCDETYILSAHHGLVILDEVLEPYDVNLASMRRAERQAWAARVSQSLLALFPMAVRLSVFAGHEDAAWLRHGVGNRWPIDEVLRGLTLGARLRWLRLAQEGAATRLG
jgi:hypothetical protein